MTKLFEGVADRYNGVTVDTDQESSETNEFLERLQGSLRKWDEEKKRCIWFKVYIKDAELVPILAKEGFNFHHSRDNFVMMYKWLPKNCIANLPPASHTNLGVGGLVINSNNEILVVSENYMTQPQWKLPGGYVERGEDIKDGAIREVKEETGIDTVFESMVTLRHTHKSGLGNSDIYIVVLLKPLTQEIMKSDLEIKACKWMSMDEYFNHPHVSQFNRFIVQQAAELQKRKTKLSLNKNPISLSSVLGEVTYLTFEDLDESSCLPATVHMLK